MTNLAGEALPPCYIFDTNAKQEQNFQLSADWTIGIPVVEGMYGLSRTHKISSYLTVKISGCMNTDLFEKIIQKVVMPLYPDLYPEVVRDDDGNWVKDPIFFKTDTGQGRLTKTLENVEFRECMRNMGVLIYLSLPNATSVTAEMDDLYTSFNPCCRMRTKKLFGSKLKEKITELEKRRSIRCLNQLKRLESDLDFDEVIEDEVHEKVGSVISLDYSDVPVINNGIEGDPPHLRPFQHIFTHDRIRKSWANIGFLLMTRKHLKSNKVRHELGELTDSGAKLSELQDKYKNVTKECIDKGFNNVFHLHIPQKVDVKRSDDEEKQIEDILKNKSAFRPSGLFLNTANMLARRSVLIEAQKRVIIKSQEKKKIREELEKSEEEDKKNRAVLS